MVRASYTMEEAIEELNQQRGLEIGANRCLNPWPAKFHPAESMTLTRWLASGLADKFYVWLHLDAEGVPFYAGRGTGTRAWDAHGGSTWEWFVTHKLGGEYGVLILAHSMNEPRSSIVLDQALELYGLQLLNAQNYARGMDFKALEEHRLIKRKVNPYHVLLKSEYDVDARYALACEALELQYALFAVSLKTEKGRFGRICFEMSPCSGLHEWFLTHVVRYLVAKGDLAGAKAALARHWGHLEGLGVPIPTSPLQKIIDRGKYTHRARGPKTKPQS